MTEFVDPYYGIEAETATRLFLEVAACLRADPVLSARVCSWVCPGRKLWMADREAEWVRLLSPGSVPLASDCPCVRIMPEPRDGQPMDNVQHQASLTCRVEVWLASDDPISLLNFWGRVQVAVLGSSLAEGRTVRARLVESGAITGEVLIDQPILGSALSGTPASRLIGAEGRVSVTYKIRGT